MFSADRLPTISKGSVGPVVRELLCFLREQGLYAYDDCLDENNPEGAEVGSGGDKAIRAFQQAHFGKDDGEFTRGGSSWKMAIKLGFSSQHPSDLSDDALFYALKNVPGGVEKWVESWRAELLRGEITTPERQAAFLSQLAAESGQGRYTEEIWGNPPSKWQARYDIPGNKLGNKPGEGKLFRGRGFLQVTGRSNYTKIGEQLGLPLTEQPELLARGDYAMTASVQWWINNRANLEADKYDSIGEDAIRRVSRLVNTGRANNKRKALGEDEHRLPYFRTIYKILVG